jgi:hypothetical protein
MTAKNIVVNVVSVFDDAKLLRPQRGSRFLVQRLWFRLSDRVGRLEIESEVRIGRYHATCQPFRIFTSVLEASGQKQTTFAKDAGHGPDYVACRGVACITEFYDSRENLVNDWLSFSLFESYPGSLFHSDLCLNCGYVVTRSVRRFFCSVSAFDGLAGLDGGETGIESNESNGSYLHSKTVPVASAVLLAFGFVLLYKIMWKSRFDTSSNLNDACYVALMVFSMALIACSFGLLFLWVAEHSLATVFPFHRSTLWA